MGASLPLLRICNAIVTAKGDFIKISLADGEGDATIYRNVCVSLDKARKIHAEIVDGEIVIKMPLSEYKPKGKTEAKAEAVALDDECPF